MTPEDTTIVINGRATRVTLVAESEVARGRLAGAVRREHVDSDGGLVVRYDQDLTEAELHAARAAQAQNPAAQALAASLSPAHRGRVYKTPSGTVVRVDGQGWARHGTLYLVGPTATPVPRLLLAPPVAAPPIPAPILASTEPCPAPTPLRARGRFGDRGNVSAPPPPQATEPEPEELAALTLAGLRPRLVGWRDASLAILEDHRQSKAVSWRSVHALPVWAWLDGVRVVHASARSEDNPPDRSLVRWPGVLAFTKNRWTLVRGGKMGMTPDLAEAGMTTVALSLVLEGPELEALLPLAEVLRRTGRYSETRLRVVSGLGTNRVGGKAWAEPPAQGSSR